MQQIFCKKGKKVRIENIRKLCVIFAYIVSGVVFQHKRLSPKNGGSESCPGRSAENIVCGYTANIGENSNQFILKNGERYGNSRNRLDF
jgi:hypothetical protein